MAYIQTATLDLDKAVVGSNQPFETASINSNWDKIDAAILLAQTNLDVLQVEVDALEAGTSIVAIDGGTA